jgi:dihydropteroate synthase
MAQRMTPTHWQTSRFRIDLSQPRVMGIVNVTPDSFSDGGRYFSRGDALKHAEQLLKEGAHILDIGGESSRPGALPVALEDELSRVLPLVREMVKWNVPLSIDTYKPEVMQAVLDAGADIINDIWALRMPGAEQAVAAHPRCGVCIMHMHREPQSMQVQPMQGDVLPQVREFLAQRVQALQAAGVAKDRISIDPGIGFGKTVEQNFSLLARQAELLSLGLPLLAGWSRKSSLSAVVGHPHAQVASLDDKDRIPPSVAAAVLAVDRGARVVRVHDVAATVSALKVWGAMRMQADGRGD